MPPPIRDPWWNRPGWSEYLAPRVGGGKHWGYDSYCAPLTNVYSIGAGVVREIGYAAGGFGHYVTVWYPDLGITQREAHLNERPNYTAVGQKVPSGTRIGRVGRSGNAAGIFWPASSSPTGKELWHVHSQAWKGDNTRPDNNINPTLYWGGGSANPKERKNMTTLFKHSGKNLWALAGDSPGTPANWQPTESQSHANELAASHGNAVTVNAGTWANREAWYTSPLSIQVDGLAEAIAAAVAGAISGLPGGSPADPAVIAEAVASELADEFASIPTADENGQAAREAIVRD